MKNFYLLLIIGLFPILSPTAHTKSIDSLQTAFNKAATDTAKLSILFQDAPSHYFGKPPVMIDLYHQGYLIAQRLNDKSAIFKSLFATALIYIYDKSDEGTGFQWLQKALVAAEIAQNNRSIQLVYYTMGIVHDHQGNQREMYEAFYKSVDYGEKSDNPHEGAFSALAQKLLVDNRWVEYLDINKRWVALMEKVNAKPEAKLNAYNNLASALSKFPDKKQEYNYYFAKARNLLNKIPDLGEDIHNLILAASIYYKFNLKKEAILYANKVLNLTNNDDYTLASQGQTHLLLAEIYESDKNYPLSIQHLKAYQAIESEQLKKRLTEESGKKIIKAEAERDLLLKQKEVDKHKWLAILSFVIAVLLLMCFVLTYLFYKREQKTKQELAKLNANKDKLFAHISHDLMSPLANFKSILMLPEWGLLSQAEFNALVKDLSIKAHNLYSTCENMLHWAITQMEGMKANIEKINVAEVINEQISLLEPIAQAKNITIRHAVDKNLVLQIDKNHLGLIIRNLLQNALKFTNKNGIIIFRSQYTEGGYQLMINDNGVGMPPHILSKLFKVEENANRKGTAQESGTGLGLILTKELLELNLSLIHI